MASSSYIDVNIVSRNTNAGNNRIIGLNIDSIMSVDKNRDNVTVIRAIPPNKNSTSMTPVRYKVLETLGDIIVKANNANFDNGLITLTVTQCNNSVLVDSKTVILNRNDWQNLTPIYSDAGAVLGTKIVAGVWFKTIWYVTQDLVTNTSSS